MLMISFFFNVIRYKNILMCTIHQIILYYYLFNKYNFNFELYNLFNLCFSHFLMGAYIYLLNDIFDIETDIINKPERPLVRWKKQNKPFFPIYIFTFLLGIFGIVFGFMASKYVGYINIYGNTIPFLYELLITSE